MGKSPGKWIKTLLFGKKATRSHSSKKREVLKGLAAGKAPLAPNVDSPVTPGPTVYTGSYVANSELEISAPKELGNEESIVASTVPVLEKDVWDSSREPDVEKMRQDLAATKLQATFRGYLARRAFGALKGIIRLQALIRGYLVRRQAVSTLHSLLGIIKFQALVRGHKVRSSGIGLEVSTKFSYLKGVMVKKLDSKERQYANAFVVRLVSSSITRMPLRTQYIQCEPNSIFSWLERWTTSQFWKQPLHARKITGSKTRAKRSNYAMETESGRSKRGVRRDNTPAVDFGLSINPDPEKPKRILRKNCSPAVDPTVENPQSELENVKRNLRKVSNLMTETSDHIEIDYDKSSPGLKKLSSMPSHAPDQSIENSVEKVKDEVPLNPDTKLDLETELKAIPVHVPYDDPSADLVHPLPIINGDDSVPILNDRPSSKDGQNYNENLKNIKRRASFAAKSECEENGQMTPTIPSYMATTESAKAKLRAYNLPRVYSDSVQMARRHSLPSANSKMSLHSPRTQKIVPANGKCVRKNDRTLLPSGDGYAEKMVHVEWRR